MLTRVTAPLLGGLTAYLCIGLTSGNYAAGLPLLLAGTVLTVINGLVSRHENSRKP